MLEKSTINAAVENYLNGKTDKFALPIDGPLSNIDSYRLNCVRRLVRAFDLLKYDGKYYGDFCMALRGYLISFQISITLLNFHVSDGDAYGLWQDESDGSIHASYQIPDYINCDFVQQVFLSADLVATHKPEKHNLSTDPMVCALTGYSSFKSLAQKLAIYGALNTPEGYTSLISLPTGGGKSLVTQTVSYQTEGLTIIIVPTVSLAIDQVRVAKKAIHTPNPDEEIFYYSSGIDATGIINAIKNKTAQMLFISPEALILNSQFTEAINQANKIRYLKSIIIDEAHIVVDWGSDFRVDYQCLESWRKKLMVSNPQIKTILLSATYEPHCITILKDFFSNNGKWIEVRCDSLRHEPRFSLVNCKSRSEKNKRIVELVRKLPHPLIVYVARPDEAEDLKRLLHEKGINNVETFTGLTTSSQRRKLIDSWVDNEFEIMVATSAFGVGVDKSDIRTVLHTYVPQNPNAYYQELGRGGRDRLPCLSVMCITGDDVDVSFTRITKKVMTTEKIIGRWNSLYNHPESKRIGNFVYIDTTVKPSYSIDDPLDDTPTSDRDVKWNVYVILLLRRYGKIRIDEVIPQQGKYIFVIEVIDDALRSNDESLQKAIDEIHDAEWDYHVDAYQLMKFSIKHNGKRCWSEMFFETYDKVAEYCAGCCEHQRLNAGDSIEFPLKASIALPVRQLLPEQEILFGKSSDVIVRADFEYHSSMLVSLIDRNASVVIVPKDYDVNEKLAGVCGNKSVLILDIDTFRELSKKKSWFYLSGMIGVVYAGTDREIYKQLMTVQQSVNRTCMKVVHVIPEGVYFPWINKAFTDLIDGPVISVESFSM